MKSWDKEFVLRGFIGLKLTDNIQKKLLILTTQKWSSLRVKANLPKQTHHINSLFFISFHSSYHIVSVCINCRDVHVKNHWITYKELRHLLILLNFTWKKGCGKKCLFIDDTIETTRRKVQVTIHQNVSIPIDCSLYH